MRKRIECNILLSDNKTLFNIDQGWEGIPFNILWNTLICAGLMIFLVLVRWRNFRTQDDPKKNNDWLHFVFRDHKSNDMKTAKYRLINRRHRLAYLPPILHEYEHLITNKIEEKRAEVESEQYFQHISDSDSQKSNKSFDTLPTLRSDSVLSGETESKINQMYSGFGVKKYNSKEEEEEVMRLKSILIENYRSHSQSETKTQMIKDKEKPFFGFDWFYDYILIKDEEILLNKGGDALQYLLFQRYLICFLAYLTLICLVIILPINLHGNAEPEEKTFAKTTISNLGKGSNLIWVHTLMTLIIAPLGIYMMSHFSKLILSEARHIDHRILLIQNIPESKRKTTDLLKFFEKKFPKAVIKRITFVHDIRQLQYLKNQLLTAIEAKKYCYQYRLLYGQRMEVRPYSCGRCGGFCLCCACCPKLDGVLYYAEEKAELESEIEIEVKEVVSKPIGEVFIEFGDKTMAEKVREYFHSKAFTFSSWCHSIKTMLSAVNDPMMSHQWKVNYAPYPENIEWYDISWESRYEALWNLLMHIILVFIFLFLTTPSIAVETILMPLTEKAEMGSLTQFLRPYLLMVMTAILPSLIMVVQYQIPYNTKSALDHALMYKSYLFLIFMVLILPPLKIYTAAVLVDSVLTPNSTTESSVNWNCLFPPGNSGFFLNYVLSSATVGNIFEVSRLSELFTYLIYLFYVSRSMAEYESARQKMRFQFIFGIRYARVLLMFTIVVTYSISSPLISVSGLFFMVIKHLVDRYNILYAYNPTQICYRMHSSVVVFVHMTLIFLLIQVSTTLSQYEDDSSFIRPSTPVILMLFVFLVIFIFNLCKRFSRDSDK